MSTPCSNKLLYSIVMFVLLDYSGVLINFWIADHVSQDAVAINLAGSQRMLSQRIAKSLLMLNRQTSAEIRFAQGKSFVPLYCYSTKRWPALPSVEKSRVELVEWSTGEE